MRSDTRTVGIVLAIVMIFVVVLVVCPPQKASLEPSDDRPPIGEDEVPPAPQRGAERFALEGAAQARRERRPVEKGVRVLGMVVSDEGVPVSGASVCFRPFGQLSAVGAPCEATTDEVGRYVVDLHRSAAWTVSASKGLETTLTEPAPVSLPLGGTWTIAPLVLVRPATVGGRVVDSEGRPVEGAVVFVESSTVILGTSNLEGRFAASVATWVGGEAVFRARKEGYAPKWRTYPRGHLRPGTDQSDLELVLEPLRTVSGSVVERGGSSRLAREVEISSYRVVRDRGWDDDNDLLQSTTTDLTGRFEIGVPRAGPFSFMIRSNDHEAVRFFGDGSTSSPIRLSVSRATRVPVTLRVTDAADGRSIGELESVTIRTALWNKTPVPFRAVVDDVAAERVVHTVSVPVARVGREGWIEVTVVAPGYLEGTSARVETEDGGTSVVEISLVRGGVAEGTVTRADTGESVAGARIQLAGNLGRRSTFADQNGGFRFDGLREDVYVPGFSAEGFLPVDGATFRAGPERPKVHIAGSFEARGGDVSVLLATRGGDPVPDTFLRMTAGERSVFGSSDAAGRIHFAAVPPGTWGIFFDRWSKDAPRPSALEVDVAEGRETSVDVALEDMGVVMVSGKITKAGRAAGRYGVEIYSAHGEINVTARADDAGQFKMTPVPPGSYRLVVRSRECQDILLRRRISVGVGMSPLSLTLYCGRVEVSIAPQAGVSPRAVKVGMARFWIDPEPEAQSVSVPWMMGDFPARDLMEGESCTIDDLPPGRYRLSARPESGSGMSSQSVFFDLADGEVARRRITLFATASLVVHVPPCYRSPLYSLALMEDNVLVDRVVVFDQETVELDKLRPGTYELRLQDRGEDRGRYRVLRAWTITVLPGQRYEHNVLPG